MNRRRFIENLTAFFGGIGLSRLLFPKKPPGIDGNDPITTLTYTNETKTIVHDEARGRVFVVPSKEYPTVADALKEANSGDTLRLCSSRPNLWVGVTD